MYYHKIIIIFTKVIIFYKMSIKQHKHNQTNNIRIKCENMMWEFLGQICYKCSTPVGTIQRVSIKKKYCVYMRQFCVIQNRHYSPCVTPNKKAQSFRELFFLTPTNYH